MAKRVLLSRALEEPLANFECEYKKRRSEIQEEQQIIPRERPILDALVLRQCISAISYFDKISFERVSSHMARILRSTYERDVISLRISSEYLPPEDVDLIQKVFEVNMPVDYGSHKLTNRRLRHKKLSRPTERFQSPYQTEIRVSNGQLKVALTAIWSRFRRWLYLCVQHDSSFNTIGQILNVLRKNCCRPLLLQKFELSAKCRPDFRLLQKFSSIVREVILPEPNKSYLTHCLMGIKWRNLKAGARRFDRAASWTRKDIVAMWSTVVECKDLRKITYRGPTHFIDLYEWRTNIKQRLKTIACFRINDAINSADLNQWFLDNTNIRSLYFGEKCLPSSLLSALLTPNLNPLLKRLRTIGLVFSSENNPQTVEQDIFGVMLLLSENGFLSVAQAVDADDLNETLEFWSDLAKKSRRWVKLKLLIEKDDIMIEQVESLNSYLASFSGGFMRFIKPISKECLPYSSVVSTQLFISPLERPGRSAISSE